MVGSTRFFVARAIFDSGDRGISHGDLSRVHDLTILPHPGPWVGDLDDEVSYIPKGLVRCEGGGTDRRFFWTDFSTIPCDAVGAC